uniref:Translocation protein SEC63 n=1 Tax=Tetraselmis sp. GSL018 TaxID=582737 RepID=A0A061RGL9_9CHLO|mmetsp:Transcript_4210/g.10163  ORF Transcript_4210/g.10163 Transcript_4210/m.10163 type:complete len:700 (+) Transcript_4210:149-2248(+)
MDEGTKHQGSSPLFAIFCLSLLVLFLVPYSIYQLCCGAENEKTHKAWAKSGKTKSSLSKALRGSCTRGKIIMLLLWGAVAGLLFYIQTSQKEIAPFDPFAIMELSPDATEKEVKKQYYKLAKERHPDKNPDDPQAAEKFDLLAKAYNALTDETARENYKKYGHPDGPQAMNIGVAMPSFLFNPDKQTAPIMLLALVGIGILLPLAVAACYLTRSNKYAGPNQVQHETLGLWLTHHKFGIKESQGLRRILDTLVVAKEFIDMPVPSTQAMALEELKKLVMRFNPELKGLKQDFWKRKASIVKAHMLLIVFMERAEDEIPEILKPDLKMILQRSPSLLAELMNVAVYPRKPYFLYAWMCPAVAVVEMMQCLTQAVPVRVRKPTPTSSGKSDKTGEAAAGIMQLPWMDAEIAKKLAKRKVKSLGELSAMPVDERGEALLASGYSKEHIEDVETFLSAMPTVHAEAGFHVEGHASIMEGDMVTADVRVALTRPSHKATKSKVDADRLKGVEAYAPHYPQPREEKWYFLLCDASHNLLMANACESLLEAESAGAAHPEKYAGGEGTVSAADDLKATRSSGKHAAARAGITNGEAEDDDLDSGEDGDDDDDAAAAQTQALLSRSGKEKGKDDRQLVQLRFMAPMAGKYNLQLHIMSDCWIGARPWRPSPQTHDGRSDSGVSVPLSVPCTPSPRPCPRSSTRLEVS